MVAKKKKTKTAIAPAAVDNELIAETLAQMPEELRTLAEKAKEYTKSDHQMVLDRWNLGKLVAEATNNERKYGEAALRQLAIVLYGTPEQEHLLSRCRVFANTYALGHVKDLLKRQGATAKLTWSHFDMLCQLIGSAKTTKKREKLELRILDENLGVRATRAEISRIQGGKSTGGAREAARPRNPVAGLQQLAHACQLLTSRDEIYLDDVFKPLTEIEDDAVTANLVEQLNTAYQNVSELRERLDSYHDSLNELIEKTAAVISANSELDGDDDGDADDGVDGDAGSDADVGDDDEDAVGETEEDETEAPQKARKAKKGKKSKKRKTVAAV